MRQIDRCSLSCGTRLALRKRQGTVSDAATARAAWSAFRQSADAVEVIEALQRMAGARARCMYCSDSRGADVDHYAPIAVANDRTFVWPNLLWACPECNRRKRAKFPTDKDGGALIIDPTRTDPYRHLVLDTATAVLAPRFGDDGQWDTMGDSTLEVLDTLNFEFVVETRARAIRRVRRAFEAVVDQGDTSQTRADLLQELRDDDMGVAAWFLRWEGALQNPYAVVRADQPRLWQRAVRVAPD